jgi:hypothetical protein
VIFVFKAFLLIIKRGFFIYLKFDYMKKNIENGLIIRNLSDNNMEIVANELTIWQNNGEFNNFLKEKPMNIEENFSFLKHKML